MIIIYYDIEVESREEKLLGIVYRYSRDCLARFTDRVIYPIMGTIGSFSALSWRLLISTIWITEEYLTPKQDVDLNDISVAIYHQSTRDSLITDYNIINEIIYKVVKRWVPYWNQAGAHKKSRDSDRHTLLSIGDWCVHKRIRTNDETISK